MVAPVGGLEYPLVVVPLCPVAALLADFGLGFGVLVGAGDDSEGGCDNVSIDFEGEEGVG